MAKPIPEGTHTVTPHLVVKGGDRAIDFYRRAFGAQELGRMPGPDGRSLMHAALKIGDSVIYLADELPGASRSPLALKGSATASSRIPSGTSGPWPPTRRI